ncbi:MFS transporter [Porticoccaceae bacterium]|nr:MFS transporter [Porticoccaceae bacterium]
MLSRAFFVSKRVSLNIMETNDQQELNPSEELQNKDLESFPYRMGVLVLLFMVYALNYLDRQIIGILAVPIKTELELSDTQLGLMGGVAFALFYSILGIPIARWADRTSRVGIITTALTLWSGFTAVCGMATGFWQLFLARLGVGVGEAGGVAPSYSLICDYFPKHQRARALGFFSLALPVGSALGLFIGGNLAAEYGWRAAFIVLGGVGLVLAPVFFLLVKEPPRGRLDMDEGSAPDQQCTFMEVVRTVLPKPSFWYLSLGSAVAAMLTYGLSFWLPSFVQRSLQMDLPQTAQFLAAAALIGGVSGILIGGFLGDYLGQKRSSAYGYVPAIAFLIALPFMVGVVIFDNLGLVFFTLLVPQAMGLVWAPPSIAAIQKLAPAHMRATSSAIFLFIANLIGLGLGTVVFGVVSDLMTDRYGTEALRWAILICCVTLYPLAAFLYLMVARTLPKDLDTNAT